MNIEEYSNHNELIPFYVRRGIEGLDEFPSEPLFSYIVKEGERIIAASTCNKNGEFYILEAIVVEEGYEGKGIGTRLLRKNIQRLKELNVDSIIINAKNISFFKKEGFDIIDRNTVPISEYSYCETCEEYEKTCFPKVMKYTIKTDK